MKRHYDAVVIGGGIIGSAIAYHLAKENKNIALFESGTMGGRTTSAAAGMLGAHAECEERDAFFDFAMHSQRLYKGLGEELYTLSGIDIRQHNGGMFKLAFSEEDVLRLRKMDDLDSVSWHTKEEVLEKSRIRLVTFSGQPSFKMMCMLSLILFVRHMRKQRERLGLRFLSILLSCKLNVTVKRCPSRRRMATYGRIMSWLPAGYGAECFLNSSG